MSDEQKTMDKIKEDINEDLIIKAIMLEYPEIYNMLEFNEFTIKEKLEKNAYWYQNFRLLSVQEKRKLTQLNIIYDKHIGELYHKLRFENDVSLGKTEVEKYYLLKDPTTVKLRKLIMKQTIRVETFDAIKDAFKQQGFNMAQFIKNMEL